MSSSQPALAALDPSLPESRRADGIAESGLQHTLHSVTNQATGSPTTFEPTPRLHHVSREQGRSQLRGETRREARQRSMDLIAESNGDVENFVQELEQKRKELDDHIHRFIAQKEREFKRYEQEIRKKYQTSQTIVSPQGDSPSATVVSSPARKDIGISKPDLTGDQVRDIGVMEDSENMRSRIDRRSANSGLEDVRPSYEREKDFMGLFTPSFLPLLEGKSDIARSPSAPALTDSLAISHLQADRQSLQRSYTEPILDAEGNARPKYGQRSSSTGSEGLVSALKTSGGKKNPKPMRVMLQLADDQPAVHPNDDLPTEREYTPVRQAEAMHHSKKNEDSGRTNPEYGLQSPSLPPASQPIYSAAVNHSPTTQSRSALTQELTSRSINSPSLSTSNARSEHVQDFEDLASPFPLDEEVNDARSPESEWEVDFQEDISQDPQDIHMASPLGSPTFERPDPDLSPEPDVVGGLGTPILKIRSSSSSSGHPTSPGFRRPSVREDPKLNIAVEEDESVEDTLGHGSLYDAFSRPSVSKNTMTGSLGESYMQRNAEAMMRRRRS